MAFFKFRKGGDEHATAPSSPAPESLEVLRKRARHRLIGAAVLVLLGVIGFPLLFDSQPRPIAVDIAIEIPDKNKVKPLRNTAPLSTGTGSVVAKSAVSEPVASSAPVTPVAAAPASASRVATGSLTTPAVALAQPAKPAAPKPDAKPEAKAESKPEPKPEPKHESKPAEKVAEKATAAQDSAKAQALLDGREADRKTAAATEGRFVVQVGAFSDVLKAREARVKLERAGLKTYTQVVEAKEGRRIRVRVGPFASKQDADKAAEKIKKLDLPAGILEL